MSNTLITSCSSDRAMNEDRYAPVEELLRNVRKAVSKFTSGAEQFDDLTMLAVEYNGPETE